jgi:hypothetical protein
LRPDGTRAVTTTLVPSICTAVIVGGVDWAFARRVVAAISRTGKQKEGTRFGLEQFIMFITRIRPMLSFGYRIEPSPQGPVCQAVKQ